MRNSKEGKLMDRAEKNIREYLKETLYGLLMVLMNTIKIAGNIGVWIFNFSKIQAIHLKEWKGDFLKKME
jgi:hypothetical protein